MEALLLVLDESTNFFSFSLLSLSHTHTDAHLQPYTHTHSSPVCLRRQRSLFHFPTRSFRRVPTHVKYLPFVDDKVDKHSRRVDSTRVGLSMVRTDVNSISLGNVQLCLLAKQTAPDDMTLPFQWFSLPLWSLV